MKKRKTTNLQVENTDEEVYQLQKLVAEGEGPHLELKRRASPPEKIVKEMIAFANTSGGTLLVGVNDDQALTGVKYPDEEIYVITEALKTHCRPPLVYHETVIDLSPTTFIVRLDIPPGSGKLHHFLSKGEKPQVYVRVDDMCIQASAEMEEIVRRSRKKTNIRFQFGESEKKLMEYLEERKAIDVAAFMQLVGLNHYKASRKLILLVLANVLQITATKKGDLYSRV